MPKKQPLLDAEQHIVVQQQTPLVEKIANGLVRRLPANIEREDLLQDGLIGLIDAIVRWTRETTGAHFENYVAQRARGAMLDGLRAADAGPRKLRKDMRRVEVAIQRLGHELGRAPREGEVAAALELPLAQYRRILQDADGYAVVSLEDLGAGADVHAYLGQCADNHLDPLVVLQRAALRQALAAAILALPEQKKTMLRLYYEDKLKMHEIAARLRVSVSRVSRLHAEAIALLRVAIIGDDGAASLLKPRSRARTCAAGTDQPSL